MKKTIFVAIVTVLSSMAYAGGGGTENKLQEKRIAECTSDDKKISIGLSNSVEEDSGAFWSGHVFVDVKDDGYASLIQSVKEIEMPTDIARPMRYTLNGKAESLSVSSDEVIDGSVNASMLIQLLPQRAAIKGNPLSYLIQLKIRSEKTVFAVKKVFTCRLNKKR